MIMYGGRSRFLVYGVILLPTPIIVKHMRTDVGYNEYMEEIELTYLARRDISSKIAGLTPKPMLDIYVPGSDAHPGLRIRRSGEKHEITKKRPIKEGDSSHMLETTIPLTQEEFADLALVPGKRVEKDRYIYKEGGHAYEIDVFRGALSGLVLVDIEFETLGEKSKFTKPLWCLADVTQEKFVAGGMICGKKYADIEGDLARFGYEKIII